MSQLMIPYFILAGSLIAYLANAKWEISHSLFVISIITALVFKRVEIVGVIIMVIYLGLFYLLERDNLNKICRTLLYLLVLALSICFFIHCLPGFENLIVINQVKLSLESSSYSLWLNFDKPLIAIGFLYFLKRSKTINFSLSLRSLIKVVPLTIFILMLLSFLLGYTHFDYKMPDFIFVWAFKVLFLTCFAEECLFRGFIWSGLKKVLKNEWIILFITSAFFGLAHFAGGWKYVLLSTVAGGFYGYIYKLTKRIGFSIALHFLVNLFHILFFSYPNISGT